MRRRTGSKIGLIAVTLIFLFVAAYFCADTVLSKADLNPEEMESYYQQQEKELVEELREYLNKAGLENSGITLTRVIDVDGIRQYKITIHHRRIDAMGEEERQFLLEKLGEIVFEDENSTLCHEFLINH